MKLSEYIESLQKELDKHGDANVYTLDEVGFEVHFKPRIEAEYKAVEELYYDAEKDEIIGASKVLDRYVIY